ncbi:hypothetical protein INT47_003253 [Mucor saturninus]|uniref:Uncharacterized protein n=1 Tax=Mucor saturninus TaxID=64648 RepID=A0A8H7RII3_9FUNG|nr:hypothetical protein INT47_003253 [Mucor saturninus]
MNKTHNLPSITTLLSSPPRIVVVRDDGNQHTTDNDDALSPRYLKSPTNYNDRLSATLSPMLSPIDSYASSIHTLSPNITPLQPTSPLPAMLALPPLQGDDPPRRLQRHPSISSIASISPKPAFNSLWSSSAPSSPRPLSRSPSPAVPSTAPSHKENTQPLYQARLQNAPQPPERAPHSHQQTPEELQEEPQTQIILSESGHPILKRRRGRPPNMREPSLEGGWTFLTPTVWDVNHPQQGSAPATLPSTSDSVMNGSMAAFTSSNMDMVLQMPRKKRGRKPKTHIVGNSCFVWKDITAARRSTKVIKEQQKAALRRLEQAPL